MQTFDKLATSGRSRRRITIRCSGLPKASRLLLTQKPRLFRKPLNSGVRRSSSAFCRSSGSSSYHLRGINRLCRFRELNRNIWHEIDLNHPCVRPSSILVMLEFSFAALAFSLLPLVMTFVGIQETIIWRTLSGLVVVGVAYKVISTYTNHIAQTPHSSATRGRSPKPRQR